MVRTAVERFGRIDVLGNVAGIMNRFLPVAELTDDVWDRVLAVNLTGPMLTSRAAIPPMIQQGGGVIVNVASVAGLHGGRAGTAYTASKHGPIGLTRNLAATYGVDGIRAVAIAPGGVETRMGLGGDPSQRGFATLEKTMPASPKPADPREIATVALFLASGEASFVNGAVLVADGGWTAH